MRDDRRVGATRVGVGRADVSSVDLRSVDLRSVDVSEWASKLDIGIPVLLSAEVESLLETVPWCEARTGGYRDRLGTLLTWARLSFDRLRLTHRLEIGRELSQGLTSRFCAPVRASTEDPCFTWFELAYRNVRGVGPGLEIRLARSKVR